MTEKASDPLKPQETSGRLPALTAKRHGSSPFRPLAPGTAEPRALGDQVRADPAVSSLAVGPGSADDAAAEGAPRATSRPTGRSPRTIERGRGKARPKHEEDLVRLQTLIPFETQLAFKMHCARSRTTINDELRRLIERFLAKQP